MAKTKAVNPKAKKHSAAVTVFNIIFIVLAVIAVAVAVMMAVPPIASAIKSWLVGMGEVSQNIANKLEAWVNYHVCQNLNLPKTFRGRSAAFCAAFYAFMIYLVALLGFFMFYVAFLRMGRNVRKGKKEGWRKALCWIAAILVAICFLALASLLWKQRCIKTFGSLYSWFSTDFEKYTHWFADGRPFGFLRLKFLCNDYTINGLFYIILLFLIIELVLLGISAAGKAKKTAVAENKAEEAKAEEAVAENEAPEAIPATPVVAVAAAAETPKAVVAAVPAKESGRVVPSVHELAVLNSLETINPMQLDNLPGLYETNVDEILEDLEPSDLEKVENSEEEEQYLEKLEPSNTAVDVLPGIDEFDSDPFAKEAEEEPVEEAKPEEAAPVEEKPVEEAVAEETAPVEEKPVEEAVAEEPVAEETKPVEEAVAKEAKPEVQEPVETVAPTSEDEKMEEPEEKKPVVVAINDLPADDRRPQEQEHEAVAKAAEGDRSDKKAIILNNDHDEVVTREPDAEEHWILPPYVEEEKPVEEAPAEEAAPVEEEKPVEEAKPAPRVKQMEGLKPVIGERKPRPQIRVLDPIVKEEEKPVEEEKPEEKKLAAVNGPLHSTEKSRHEKIEKVQARKVRFELRNYQIKTYEGDLTAEEAFSKGVTKVQPSVNPVFANQNSKEPAWKQKRREEAIRKNGYGDVTEVKNLKDNRKAEKPTAVAPVRGKSIRDMLKAKKAEEAKAVETPTQEAEKPAVNKPIKPIKLAEPNKPAEPAKKEENPFGNSNAPAFHPIAPIAHKAKPRPDIKPVDPNKSHK